MTFTHKKMVLHLVELLAARQSITQKETVFTKFSKAIVHRKTHTLLTLKFEDQKLTSYDGLVLYQSLLATLCCLE